MFSRRGEGSVELPLGWRGEGVMGGGSGSDEKLRMNKEEFDKNYGRHSPHRVGSPPDPSAVCRVQGLGIEGWASS